MSRTDACGISQSCTPAPPTYPLEEPDTPAAEPPPGGARDRLARPGAAQARLTRLSGATRKYAGGQGMSPSPALEQDPAVQRYRYSPEDGRYQVTRYDPELVRFTRDGRPLTGPTVTLDNRQTRLDDAIQTVRDRAVARIKAVRTLEETPFGTKALLSAGQCRPVYTHLLAAIQHTARAEELLRAGKGEAAKQALARATQSYNDAAIKLNSAKRQIENNVELTVGLLKALKAAGEVAEIGLTIAGAGAVGKAASGLVKAAGGADWAISTAKVVGGAAAKTGITGLRQARDQLLDPEKTIDWSKIGNDAAKNMVWNLISGGFSHHLGELMKAADTGPTKELLARVGQKLSVSLARKVSDIVTNAVKRNERATPRQLADRVRREAEEAIRETLAEDGHNVTESTRKAILATLLKMALTQQGR